jgi:hypothetical protein
MPACPGVLWMVLQVSAGTCVVLAETLSSNTALDAVILEVSHLIQWFNTTSLSRRSCGHSDWQRMVCWFSDRMSEMWHTPSSHVTTHCMYHHSAWRVVVCVVWGGEVSAVASHVTSAGRSHSPALHCPLALRACGLDTLTA